MENEMKLLISVFRKWENERKKKKFRCVFF